MANRVAFLVDGFNVYHSICVCLGNSDIQHGKWFNYMGYFHWLVANHPDFPKGSRVSKVKLYTAYAYHVSKPDVVARHMLLNQAIESTGVNIILGNFKKKNTLCHRCNQTFTKYEEKETDINIAMGIIEAFMNDEADIAMVVSGDTDLIAGITTARQLFPSKKIGVVTPAYRDNNEIKGVADLSMKIKPVYYQKFQFSDPLSVKGKMLHKPSGW